MSLKSKILLILTIIICITLVTGCFPESGKVDSESGKNVNIESEIAYEEEEIPDTDGDELETVSGNADYTDNADAGDREFTYAVVGTAQISFYDNRSEIESPEPGEPFYGQAAQFEGVQPA